MFFLNLLLMKLLFIVALCDNGPFLYGFGVTFCRTLFGNCMSLYILSVTGRHHINFVLSVINIINNKVNLYTAPKSKKSLGAAA